MPPWTNVPLSPAELSYLRTSLTSNPPLRPDGRAPTQFRPLIAETDILPNTNGSARICFVDGSEAVVGVKAEVESTAASKPGSENDGDGDDDDDKGFSTAVNVTVEIPGHRDDDPLPVFLSEMLCEAIVASGGWGKRAKINGRFRWRIHVDILLLSQPLSYPLPLLSLTTHLALQSARLPALVSKGDEDPLFNDDWEAAVPLYASHTGGKPPVTLLVISVGENTLFDPSHDELAVADAVVAVSVVQDVIDTSKAGTDGLRVVAIRTIDPPSRLTTAGNLDESGGSTAEVLAAKEKDAGHSVWRPPRGGLKRQVLQKMIKQTIEKGGVGEEVMEGLVGVKS